MLRHLLRRSTLADLLVVLAVSLLLLASPGVARATEPPPDDRAAGGPEPGAAVAPATPEAPPAPPPPAAQRTAAPPDAPPPPANAAGVAGRAGDATASWFFRAPLTVTVGQGASAWRMTAFGFVEADYIFDTTRSYNDAIGSALVARDDTYDGRVGRSQLSMRNTRLGFLFDSPMIGGVRPSAVLEGDFFGRQESPPAGSESTFFDSPTFRLRHAYLKLQNAYVDVLIGQTYDLFGWQSYFFPCTAEFLGLPNQVFSRSGQLRLAHTINADGAVSVDLAVSAARPAQRDSQVPDAHAGLRFSVNGWKGITTPGNTGTVALPLSIGVSAVVRQFKVNAFTPPPAQTSNHVTGWGLSVDALIPVIPAANAYDRGNRLTLTGSYVIGTGIADLMTTGGGATFPTLLNPGQSNPPPIYSPDIDSGLVSFDRQGLLHTIDWWAYRAGLQYYLPPSGRLILSVNYTYSHSDNLVKLFPMGGSEIELLGSIADTTRYADANLFWDATPAVRLGLSAQYTAVEYLYVAGIQPPNKPHNVRAMAQALYQF